MAKKTTISRILQHIRRFWPQLLLSLAMATVYVATTLFIPILVGRAIDAIPSDYSALKQCLLRVAVCAAVGAVCQWLMTLINNRVTYQVTCDLRQKAFAHIQCLPLRYLDDHPHGDLVSRVTADVDTFADGLLLGFSQLFTGALTIVGTLILMLRIHWVIAFVVLVITPISLLVANFIAKNTFSMFQAQTRARGSQTAHINETIGQMQVVKAFGHEQQTLEEFEKRNQELEKASLKAIFFSSLTNPCTRFVNSLVYAGVGLSGALIAISGGITVGNLTSFLSYANQYTKPFNEISSVITELQNALACAERVFALMDVPAQSAEPEEPKFPKKAEGRVDIRNLSFSYDAARPLIRNFHLAVKPGQRVAIVGPTGCGKTTFINLLMRFYDPDGGQIDLDGVNTLEMERGALRRSVGMVLQDTWLQAGTIRENIAMGKEDATMEEIVQAAKQAHAHSFIRRLPQGYDTVIGEQGGSLSQGQKQLLCIARVMLCRPTMLFLDEATSSIDTRTEMQIQKAFNTLMQGRTSFIVAHRLSTIQEVDTILVMRNGQIVEQGRHEELLQKDGFYASFTRASSPIDKQKPELPMAAPVHS